MRILYPRHTSPRRAARRGSRTRRTRLALAGWRRGYVDRRKRAASIVPKSVRLPTSCLVNILETLPQAPCGRSPSAHCHGTYQGMDRNKWFCRKSDESGFDELTFLNCRFSERKVIKTERISKILVSAIKQSLKARLPQLNEMTDFNKFITQPFPGQKFIAHCYEGEKPLLKDMVHPGEDALVLIGPEGDFSEGSRKATNSGKRFIPISLGKIKVAYRDGTGCLPHPSIYRINDTH